MLKTLLAHVSASPIFNNKFNGAISRHWRFFLGWFLRLLFFFLSSMVLLQPLDVGEVSSVFPRFHLL